MIGCKSSSSNDNTERCDDNEDQSINDELVYVGVIIPAHCCYVVNDNEDWMMIRRYQLYATSTRKTC